MTCDSGAGEGSPPPPPLLRTPSMMRLAMVSPTARVVAPGWRVRGGGRRRLARPVAMGVQDLAKRGARLVGGGRERVYQCRRREGGVWFVSRSTPDSGSGARIQKTGGLVVAARPPSVPRYKLVKSHCAGCRCSVPGTRRRCGVVREPGRFPASEDQSWNRASKDLVRAHARCS